MSVETLRAEQNLSAGERSSSDGRSRRSRADALKDAFFLKGSDIATQQVWQVWQVQSIIDISGKTPRCA
jgi:hypothetical protein